MQTERGASLSSGEGIGPDRSGGPDPSGGPARPRRRLWLFAGVAAVAYATDAVTKAVAVAELSDRPPVTVIPGVLSLTLVRNPGAAFGIATGLTVVLTVIALGVCLVVIKMAGRLRNPLWAVALGLLLGGALGNLTDRFVREPAPLHGHVVDFLSIPHWPVFNVADCCVSIAAVLIVLQSFRGIGLQGQRADRDSGSSDESGGDP